MSSNHKFFSETPDDGSEQSSDSEVSKNVEDKSFFEKFAMMPLSKMNELKQKLDPETFKKMCSGLSHNGNLNIGSKRPREVSSKKPVPKALPSTSKKSRKFDPRFVTECGGDFDKVKFHREYGFLDEMRHNEIKDLRKTLRSAKKSNDDVMIERTKKNLLRLENQQRSLITTRAKEEVCAGLRKSNIERMKEGLRPVFIGKHDMDTKIEESVRKRGSSTFKPKRQKSKGVSTDNEIQRDKLTRSIC